MSEFPRLLTRNVMSALAELRQRRIRRQYASFGDGSTVSRKAIVEGKHGISIGDDTHILDYAIVQCGPWSHLGLVASPESPDRLVLGAHCSIQPHAFLSTCGGSIVVGDYTHINPFCVLYGYGSLRIGNHVAIANSCVLVPQTHNIPPGCGPIVAAGVSGIGIVVHDYVWLGSHVVVLDGVEIGEGAVVGAGSVVTHSIPAGMIAAGVPARVIRER